MHVAGHAHAHVHGHPHARARICVCLYVHVYMRIDAYRRRTLICTTLAALQVYRAMCTPTYM